MLLSLEILTLKVGQSFPNITNKLQEDRKYASSCFVSIGDCDKSYIRDHGNQPILLRSPWQQFPNPTNLHRNQSGRLKVVKHRQSSSAKIHIPVCNWIT